MVGPEVVGPEDGELLHIIYDGGTTPGKSRWILPYELFRVDGYESTIYVEAYCDTRKETRVFRLDRLRFVDEETTAKSKQRSKSKPKTGSKTKDKTRAKTRTLSGAKSRRRFTSAPRKISETQGAKPESIHWVFWLAIGLLLWWVLS